MSATIRPFLMFQSGQAEAAIRLYVSLFDDGAIIELVRHGPGGPGLEGTVAKSSFVIGGQTIMAYDSPVEHAFSFTPSTSLFVECESNGQIDRLAKRLGEEVVLMPLGDYGFSRRFAWVNDRFGVSWQLNLA